MKHRIKDGFSNNPNYVGDWFGKGQIDFNAIINPDDVGDVWMVKLWSGSGYQLDVYLCKANNVYEAMDIVFKWSYENEGANNMVFDYSYLLKECERDYNSHWYGGNEPTPAEQGEEFEDFFEDWADSWLIFSENGYWAREENFFVDKVPAEVLAENGYNEVNDSRRVKDSRRIKDSDNIDTETIDTDWKISKICFESLDNDKKDCYDYFERLYKGCICVFFVDFNPQDILNGGTSLSETVDNAVLENVDKLEDDAIVGYRLFVNYSGNTLGTKTDKCEIYLNCSLVSDNVLTKRYEQYNQTIYEKDVPLDKESIEEGVREAVDFINNVQLGIIDYSKITPKEEEYDEDDEYVREQYNNYVNNIMLKDDPDMQGEWF